MVDTESNNQYTYNDVHILIMDEQNLIHVTMFEQLVSKIVGASMSLQMKISKCPMY